MPTPSPSYGTRFMFHQYQYATTLANLWLLRRGPLGRYHLRRGPPGSPGVSPSLSLLYLLFTIHTSFQSYCVVGFFNTFLAPLPLLHFFVPSLSSPKSSMPNPFLCFLLALFPHDNPAPSGFAHQARCGERLDTCRRLLHSDGNISTPPWVGIVLTPLLLAGVRHANLLYAPGWASVAWSSADKYGPMPLL